jgi:hypothetical protein
MRDYISARMIYAWNTDQVNPPFPEILQGTACISPRIDVADYVISNFNTTAVGFRFEAWPVWIGLNASYVRSLFNVTYGTDAMYPQFKFALQASQQFHTSATLKKNGINIMDRTPRGLGYNCFTEKFGALDEEEPEE